MSAFPPEKVYEITDNQALIRIKGHLCQVEVSGHMAFVDVTGFETVVNVNPGLKLGDLRDQLICTLKVLCESAKTQTLTDSMFENARVLLLQVEKRGSE